MLAPGKCSKTLDFQAIWGKKCPVRRDFKTMHVSDLTIRCVKCLLEERVMARESEWSV